MHLKLKAVVGLILGLSLSAEAGKMQSYCYMNEDSKEIAGGYNVNEKLPIASVTKVLTSLSVLSTVGARAKLYTQFYVSRVGPDLYDVYIKGARDPYFARPSMHTLISRLNEMGVKKIRTLSFDENFKYLHDTNKVNAAGGRSFNPVTGKSTVDSPNASFIRLLLLNKKEVLRDYEKSRKEAALNKVVLVEKPTYNPEKIEVVTSAFQPVANAEKGYVSSMEMIDIIKYMNWNSNNFVANSLMMVAGGVEKTEKLFYDKLRLSPADVTFENGSGQNADLNGEGRKYTEATCAATVKTVRALKKNLESQNMKLEDALAVIGGDIGSTIDAAVYRRYLKEKTVIAKTGTVGVAITLAGMASSKNGKFFFMYSVEPKEPRGRMKAGAANRFRSNEAARCRAQIGQKLAERIALADAGYALNFEFKNEKERRKFAQINKSFGKAIAYEERKYDVVNFEDSGDENAPELDEPDDVEVTKEKAASVKKQPSTVPKYNPEQSFKPDYSKS